MNESFMAMLNEPMVFVCLSCHQSISSVFYMAWVALHGLCVLHISQPEFAF